MKIVAFCAGVNKILFRLLFLVLPISLVILCCVKIGLIYAAPIDVPTKIKGLEGNILNNKELGIGLSIAGEADFLCKRKLNVGGNGGSAKVRGNFYTAKIILTIIDKFDVYGILGEAGNLEYKGDDIKFQPEAKFTWGVGLSMPVWRWDKYGVDFFTDAKYRAVNNIDYSSNYESSSPFTYSGGGYSSNTASKLLTDWQEWQVAFGAAKRFKYLTPYFGIKYSDFRESNRLSTATSDTVVGLFIGCSAILLNTFSIDLQGRFIDETAFTVKATYKF